MQEDAPVRKRAQQRADLAWLVAPSANSRRGRNGARTLARGAATPSGNTGALVWRA